MRHVNLCFMKLKIVKQLNLIDVIKSIFIRSHADDEHIHDQNYFDQIKINVDIMIVLDAEIEKNYAFFVIHRNVQNVK